MRSPPENGSAPSAATLEAGKAQHWNVESGNTHEDFRTNVNQANRAADEPAGERLPGAGGEPDAAVFRGDDADYLELCRNRSGECVDLEIFAKTKADREQLLADSHWVADALESQGIPARGESKMALVGICSGESVELPEFRNIHFIPLVAARKRAPMIKQLEYFLNRNPYARMWVFTSGDRAPLSQVRGRIQELHRRLSKLNSEPFMREVGIEIVFRSTELGSIVRNADGEVRFHLHAHTIVNIPRKLSKEHWSAVLSAVHRWWRFHFDDSKRIQQAREACKYVVKPQDLRHLKPAELAELHRALFRLHLVQPMGALKSQMAGIEERGLRLVRKRVNGSFELVLVKNWNPGRKKTEDREPEDDVPPAALRDYVVTTTVPAPYFGPKTEPAAVVLNRTGEDIRRFGRVCRHTWRRRRPMSEPNRPIEFRERTFDLPLPFRATRQGFLAWRAEHLRQRALREVPAMPPWLMHYIETQAVWPGEDPGPFQDGLTTDQAEDFRLRIEHEQKTGERLPRGSFRPW